MAQLTMSTTVVNVAAAGAVDIAPANPGRSYLAIVNVGTGNVSMSAGGAAPAADSGWPLDAAAALGRKGGSYIFETGLVPSGIVRGYASAATRLVVIEG